VVGLQDIIGLIGFMGSLKQGYPLLLLSACPGFVMCHHEEADGLVFYAGQYRALQQQQKQNGRLTLSMIRNIAVGGTYLMHGLVAQNRIAMPGTQFYDTVRTRSPVPLAQVLARGLIDAIVPEEQLSDWLYQTLAQAEA
jgi:acetyl-CoA carboxylase beta subunit